jgi:hypothetical protein
MTNKGLIRSRLVTVPELLPETHDRMYELFARHFEGGRRRRFELDLEAKQWALLLENGDGHLLGFTTLRVDRVDRVDLGEAVDVITSGDTIVAPEAWRSSRLSSAWIAAVHRLGSDRPLLWLLIASGWRTYRFLPTFWREFYPCWNRTTPQGVRRAMDRLAGELFGDAYDLGAGIVRFAEPQVLVPELRGIPEARRHDPHVDFFARANPGHEGGDELVCLTEIAEHILTPAGRRMVRRGGVELAAKPPAPLFERREQQP